MKVSRSEVWKAEDVKEKLGGRMKKTVMKENSIWLIVEGRMNEQREITFDW